MSCVVRSSLPLYGRGLLLALLLSVCFATSSVAWTMTGHSAVVEIATRYLSQRAGDQIHDLLGHGPKGLADLSMWADDIAAERPETDPWHAVDIPHDSGGYNRSRDCKNDDCIVEKIKEFARTLADRQVAKPARAETLKYLFHLVGDLHAPLHAYAPGLSDDLWKSWGGWEGPWVRIGDKADQLHIWWDWGFVAGLGSSSNDIADKLAAQITTDDREFWARGSPEDWANESFDLARSFVLKYGLIDPVRLAENSENAPIVLGAEVLDEGQSIAAQRLKMAGVRLAWLLNRALE